jgi:hypothetical protein
MGEHFPDTQLNVDQAKRFLCDDGTHSVVAMLRHMACHHRGPDAPPMDEGAVSLTAHQADQGENAAPGGATTMNDDLEELPDICAQIQRDYMVDLISENDPGRRYPEQWGHVRSCLSCHSTYLEARDWAVALSPIALPQAAAWRGLLRFDRCIAMKSMVTAFVQDIQGTLRGFPRAFQGTVMLSTGAVRSADLWTAVDRSVVPSAQDRGTREPAALTIDVEGFALEVAVEATPRGPRMSVALRDAPYPAAITVRLGEAETTLAGVGATGQLPLQEGQVVLRVIRDADTTG